MTKVLAISGSLRNDSYNTKLLRNAAELSGQCRRRVLGRPKDVPPYDEDDDGDGAPAVVATMRAAFAGADAVLISTPEYNSSVPGQLKNALDWVSRPLAHESPAQQARRRRRGFLGGISAPCGRRPSSARCSPRSEPGSSTERSQSATRRRDSTTGGTLIDEDLREQLGEVVDALVTAVAEREELARTAA